MNAESSSTSWSNTDKRFVAFLDILGFKDLVMRSTHADIYKLLSSISENTDLINQVQQHKDFKQEFEDSEIYTVSFSDSIIIFSKNDSADSFEFFLFCVGRIFTSAIENGIPIKGSIAYGEISLDKSRQIYFGQPIIDAYLLEEDLNYYGIVAHNSIDEYISESDNELYLNVFRDIPTPLKCGTINHLNLNWFVRLKGFDDSSDKIDYISQTINRFKLMSSGSPRRYIDNTLQVINRIFK